MATDTAAAPAAEVKKEDVDYPLDEAFKGHSVTRNGKTEPLLDEKILRGDFKGYHYICPRVKKGDKVTREDVIAMIDFYGVDEAAAVFQSDLKKNFQGVWSDFRTVEKDEATDAILSLSINLEGFLQECPEFTSAGMKIKDIRDLIDTRQAELSVQLQKAAANRALFKDDSFIDKLDALDREIRGLKAREEKRSGKGKKDEESQPSVAVE